MKLYHDALKLDIELKSSKVLLTGLSGTGKTYLCKKLDLFSRVSSSKFNIFFINPGTPYDLYEHVFSQKCTDLLVIDEYDMLYLQHHDLAELINKCTNNMVIISRNFAGINKYNFMRAELEIDADGHFKFVYKR